MMTNLNDEEAAEIALAATEEPDFVDMLETKIGTFEKAAALSKAGDSLNGMKDFFAGAAVNAAKSYVDAAKKNPELVQHGFAWRLSEIFDQLTPAGKEGEVREILRQVGALEGVTARDYHG